MTLRLWRHPKFLGLLKIELCLKAPYLCEPTFKLKNLVERLHHVSEASKR